MDSFSGQHNPFGIRLGFTTPQHKNTGFSNRPPNEPTTQEIRTGAEGHLISFAPTGSGKTWTLAIPTLLDYPGSVVAFDPKGELTKATAGARQAMGQDVIILDPFEITSLEAESLNPMDLALGKEPTLEDAQCLAASVINRVPSGLANAFQQLPLPHCIRSPVFPCRGSLCAALWSSRNRPEAKWVFR